MIFIKKCPFQIKTLVIKLCTYFSFQSFSKTTKCIQVTTTLVVHPYLLCKLCVNISRNGKKSHPSTYINICFRTTCTTKKIKRCLLT